MTFNQNLAKQLVPMLPLYIEFVDTLGLGCGRVWISHNKHIHPAIWHFKWPTDIMPNLSTSHSPDSYITNSNVEATRLLMHYLVLEAIVDLRHKHVACWCNNALTITWMRKSLSTRFKVGQQIIWVIMLHLTTN